MKTDAFTLIEVMVALVIMSIISVVSVRVTTSFIRTRAGIMDSLSHYDDVERAWTVMAQDLQHALPEYALDITPGRFAHVPYVFVGEQPESSVQPWLFFLRVQPRRLERYAPPLYVAYFLRDHQLIRQVHSEHESIHEDVLLSHVMHMQVEYFVDYQLRWETQWHLGDSLDRGTPSAIRLSMLMKGGAKMTHIFSLPTI